MRTFPVPVASGTAGNTIAQAEGDSPIFKLFQNSRIDYMPFKIAYAMPGETI